MTAPDSCSHCGETVPPVGLVEQWDGSFMCFGCVSAREALEADERPADEGLVKSDEGHDSARYDAWLEGALE